jgi:hypothetical protein
VLIDLYAIFWRGVVMNVRLLSFFLLCCLAMIASAQAGIVTYTLAGGTIDGSLNGTSFSGANFTITANADPKDFVDGTLTGSPLLSQPAVSTMTIDGFSPFQITSVNFAPWLFYLDEEPKTKTPISVFLKFFVK